MNPKPNPFGLVGDLKSVLSDLSTKVGGAKHLIKCVADALISSPGLMVGDRETEVPARKLANNLNDALALLDEVTS